MVKYSHRIGIVINKNYRKVGWGTTLFIQVIRTVYTHLFSALQQGWKFETNSGFYLEFNEGIKLA